MGAGIGMVMQVMVLITQNAVPVRMLGVATSSVTFFRSLGGAMGVAILGAVLSNRLTVEIGERLELSPRTVEAHLRTLYRKLGVRSRTAAARYAVEHGLAGGS